VWDSTWLHDYWGDGTIDGWLDPSDPKLMLFYSMTVSIISQNMQPGSGDSQRFLIVLYRWSGRWARLSCDPIQTVPLITSPTFGRSLLEKIDHWAFKAWTMKLPIVPSRAWRSMNQTSQSFSALYKCIRLFTPHVSLALSLDSPFRPEWG